MREGGGRLLLADCNFLLSCDIPSLPLTWKHSGLCEKMTLSNEMVLGWAGGAGRLERGSLVVRSGS